MTTNQSTCACCGHPVTEGLCCPVPPGSPWGTKCAEHEETPDV